LDSSLYDLRNPAIFNTLHSPHGATAMGGRFNTGIGSEIRDTGFRLSSLA